MVFLWCYVLRINQMIVWCLGPYSMCWVPSSDTWNWILSVVQLGSQWVENKPMHHTNLFVFFCNGFNHFWPLNIINWTFLLFSKRIPYGQRSILHGHKPYYMIMWYTLTSTWYVICQKPWHNSWEPCITMVGMLMKIHDLNKRSLPSTQTVTSLGH